MLVELSFPFLTDQHMWIYIAVGGAACPPHRHSLRHCHLEKVRKNNVP